jgi:hypothetical protein
MATKTSLRTGCRKGLTVDISLISTVVWKRKVFGVFLLVAEVRHFQLVVGVTSPFTKYTVQIDPPS